MKNYNVYKYYTGKEALEGINSVSLDLAILDVMLPDVDGFSICQRIREKYFFPIIMLTAKIEDMDKIMGLTFGADDYITKPFNPCLVEGGDVTYHNTNQLINPQSSYYYQDAVGLKTGSTNSAGKCLISAAVIGGDHYICVIMGSSEIGRWKDTINLYNAAKM